MPNNIASLLDNKRTCWKKELVYLYLFLTIFLLLLALFPLPTLFFIIIARIVIERVCNKKKSDRAIKNPLEVEKNLNIYPQTHSVSTQQNYFFRLFFFYFSIPSLLLSPSYFCLLPLYVDMNICCQHTSRHYQISDSHSIPKH